MQEPEPKKAERAGFDETAFCKLCNDLKIGLNARPDNDLMLLRRLLVVHGFLLS